MSIKEFDYLEIVIDKLNKNNKLFIDVTNKLQDSFEEILTCTTLDFLNISSRVKSENSLREKILRNKYYKKYPDGNELLYNLSDLIGIRIECRFAADEKDIYRYLKKFFNLKNEKGYYYNDFNENLLLKFEGKQPQRQKNGFTIYRLDGAYKENNLLIPFELQIKSLVNMFWGEIEHQVIYKNSNYIIENKFLKDIMNSIKQNLTMIDKQLLTVFNHFESKNRTDCSSRKKHLEEIVAKSIYDLFLQKMKSSINIVFDFKKSCDTIVRYTFAIDNTTCNDDYTEILIKALNRISEISKESIDFNSLLTFERDVQYKDSFTKILGKYFESAMNNEFNWNLFFRILFTLEPLNNVGDFEKFLDFLKVSYLESSFIEKQKFILKEKLCDDFSLIENSINIQLANSLISIDNINIVYDYNIEEINDVIESTYKYLVETINSIADWNDKKSLILNGIHEEICLIIE